MNTAEIRGTYSLGLSYFHSGNNLLNITIVQFRVKIIIICHLNGLYFEFRLEGLPH